MELVKGGSNIKSQMPAMRKMLSRKGSMIKSRLSENRGNLNTNITTTIPFQFKCPKIKTEVSKHAVICFKLLSEVKSTNTNINIRMVSIKLLLKTLNSIYYEKAMNSKDSRIIENQTLIEYLYDNFFNKYGIVNLTVKKVKEILITLKSQRHIMKLKLLAKFLCLYEDKM
jgi:hypothetical protein